MGGGGGGGGLFVEMGVEWGGGGVYATNENIHVLSMKFPHLFLRPEIIITFL